MQTLLSKASGCLRAILWALVVAKTWPSVGLEVYMFAMALGDYEHCRLYCRACHRYRSGCTI
eukprot:8309975-Ditylum_brightwellii.AAC.1